MFLSWVGAEIADREIETSPHLTVGLLGQTDRARRANAFQPRSDVDAVAHQIAVGLLDDVAEMNADAELDPLIRSDARIALDHSSLHFDCATRCIDHTAELGDEPVARALDDSAMVRGDRRLDQITEERAKPRKRALFVRACQPAITDDIGDQDRRDFPSRSGRLSPSFK